MSLTKKLAREILSNSNNGKDLTPYHYSVVTEALLLNGKGLKLMLKPVKAIHKIVVTDGIYKKNPSKFYYRINNITIDEYDEFYCKDVKLNKNLNSFSDHGAKFNYLTRMSVYADHLERVSVKFDEKAIERMKWYKLIDGVLDLRIHYMTNICNFLIKDNRFIFFWDRKKPFIWDIANMVRIYVKNIEKVKNRELLLRQTGWRSVLNMYSNSARDINELSWDNVMQFICYANIQYLELFNDNSKYKSIKSRKPLFDEIVYEPIKTKTNSHTEFSDDKILLKSSSKKESKEILDITYQFIDKKLVIHEVSCLKKSDDRFIKYSIPGVVLKIKPKVMKIIKDEIYPSDNFGQISYLSNETIGVNVIKSPTF